MDIGAIVAWFQTNWVNIVNVITAVIAAASIIVKMTPTLKDDNILLGVIKFLSKYIALNRTVDDTSVRKTL
jgi:hypothetical protein